MSSSRSLRICAVALAALLLVSIVTQASAGMVLGQCELPEPESNTEFWIKAGGGTASVIVDALGYHNVGNAIDKFMEAADAWTSGQPPSEFTYLSCELQEINHKLDLVLQQLDEIKELIVTVVVRNAVDTIDATFQGLQYMMQAAPNTSKAALLESMHHVYESAVQQDVIYKAARTINEYLTQSVSAGTDPLLLSISKNHMKESIHEYYLNVKAEASAYWDSMGKAANLLRYAANYENMSIPLYLKQAEEIEGLIKQQGMFLEDGSTVVIPYAVRRFADMMFGTKPYGQVWLRMKTHVAGGGFKFSDYADCHGTQVCFDSGRVYSEASDTEVTLIGMDKQDPNYDISKVNFMVSMATDTHWTHVGTAYNDWQRCLAKGAYVWVKGIQSWKKVYAKLPTTLVSRDYQLEHLMFAEYAAPDNKLKFTCSVKSNQAVCLDPLVSDRNSFDDVANDDDCWFDFKFK